MVEGNKMAIIPSRSSHPEVEFISTSFKYDLNYVTCFGQ